jgi:hypothetical protein
MATARTIPVLLGAAGLMAAMMLPARASVLHHLSVRPHVQLNMPLQFGLRPHPFHDPDLTPHCETERPPKKASPAAAASPRADGRGLHCAPRRD